MADREARVFLYYAEEGDWQAAEVGTTLPQPLVVRLYDQDGNPSVGVEVRFQGSDNTPDLSSRSNSEGRAAVVWRLGPEPGIQSIKASIVSPNALQPVYFQAEALVGPASQIMIAAGEPVARPGTRLDTMSVTVTDRFGNLIVNGEISWTVQSGGGSVESLSDRTDSRGRARAVWTLGPGSDAQNLLIRSGAATRLLVATPAPAFVVTRISTGGDHSCAIVEDGAAYCWGSNDWGQLGLASRDQEPHPIPRPVVGGLKFRSIAAGYSHTCGLTIAGETWCWGANLSGQSGVAAPWDGTSRPALVPGAPVFEAITVGAFHNCGLTSAGTAYCWGNNAYGQLGDGSDRSAPADPQSAGQLYPTRVAGGHTFASIQTHHSVTCGITTGGDTYCWGTNVLLNLGDRVEQTCQLRFYTGDYGDGEIFVAEPCSTVPVRVPTGGTASSLTVLRDVSCAVLTTGGLACWGFGEPLRVLPVAGITRAWLFASTVCSANATDPVSCRRVIAPFAEDRPFGDGPALVDIQAGGAHICGLSRVTSGTAYCWGSNREGALGDGTTQYRNFPVSVASPIAQRVP